jgi:hypothetical protein
MKRYERYDTIMECRNEIYVYADVLHRDRDVKLTTHSCLVPRLRMVLHSPIGLHGVVCN